MNVKQPINFALMANKNPYNENSTLFEYANFIILCLLFDSVTFYVPRPRGLPINSGLSKEKSRAPRDRHESSLRNNKQSFEGNRSERGKRIGKFSFQFFFFFYSVLTYGCVS